SSWVGDPDYQEEFLPRRRIFNPKQRANPCDFPPQEYPITISPHEQIEILKQSFVGDSDYQEEFIPWVPPVNPATGKAYCVPLKDLNTQSSVDIPRFELGGTTCGDCTEDKICKKCKKGKKDKKDKKDKK